MKLLGDIASRSLSEKVAYELKVSLEYSDVFVFPDGEKRVRIKKSVAGEEVYIIKSISPPVAENLLEFCFVIDAAKRNGAKKVVGIVPYLGYSRGDHMFRTGESSPLSVVIKTIEAAGLDAITLFDLHSIKIPELFSIPVRHESALSLFAEKMRTIFPHLDQVVIVSPDMGGVRRAKLLSEMLGVTYAVLNKERDLETDEISGVRLVEGSIEKRALILDDMISTGTTVVEGANVLFKEGVQEVYVCATHPIFSDNASSLLARSRVKRVFVTNTIDMVSKKRFKKLEILSVASLIARAIRDSVHT